MSLETLQALERPKNGRGHLISELQGNRFNAKTLNLLVLAIAWCGLAFLVGNWLLAIRYENGLAARGFHSELALKVILYLPFFIFVYLIVLLAGTASYFRGGESAVAPSMLFAARVSLWFVVVLLFAIYQFMLAIGLL